MHLCYFSPFVISHFIDKFAWSVASSFMGDKELATLLKLVETMDLAKDIPPIGEVHYV